jgi:hypothetical protein
MVKRGSPDANAPERSTEPEDDAAALLEAEVDEAIATCGGDIRAAFRATLVANAHLDAEVAQLTRRNLNGLRARARMRKPPKRVRI